MSFKTGPKQKIQSHRGIWESGSGVDFLYGYEFDYKYFQNVYILGMIK